MGAGSSTAERAPCQCCTLPCSFSVVALDHSYDSFSVCLSTEPGPNTYFSLPPSSVALERPLMSYSRALLSLELSGRVQSQSFLHTLAILDLGDLFLLLSLSTALLWARPAFSCTHSNPHLKCLERKEVGVAGGWWLVAGGWVVTMEVGFNRLNLTTWMEQASSLKH